ncbi:MAG: hypothetical protein AB8B50_19710 [Pirellulaceae bacterium]
MSKLLFGVAASCFALLATDSNAFAQEETARLTAPKLFPDKTLAYVRIDDVTKLKEDLAKSSIGKLGNDDQIKPIIGEFYGSLVRVAEDLESSVGLNLDELLSIPSGEMAIALLPSEKTSARAERQESEDGQRVSARLERPAVAMLLDAGEEISSIKIMLGRLEEAASEEMVHEEKVVDGLTLHRYQNPNRERQQFGYFIDDGVIIACSDADYLTKLAQKWRGTLEDAEALADNRKFTTIMSRCVGTEGERPQVSFYADPLAIVRQFVPRNATTSMTLAVLPALGVDGIEAVGGSWILAPPEFDSISHAHLLLSSPRRGVLSLLKPKSGSTEPEPWVPDTVASYSTINWDLASTLKGIERLYNQFRGEDALQKEVFDRLSEQLDLDFRGDLIDQMEGRVSILQGFVRPITINSGSNVYAIRINNIKYFKSKVMPKIIDQIEKRTEVRTASFGKLRANVLKMGRDLPPDSVIRQPTICFTTVDDYLLMADSEFMLRQIASCLNDSVGPLSESLEYQLIADSIQGQLQDKECSAISYARPEESLQLFYELARDPQNKERLKQFSANNPFFKALYNALDKHELPPFSVISKYLAPGGGFLVEEETGLHYMSFGLRRE